MTPGTLLLPEDELELEDDWPPPLELLGVVGEETAQKISGEGRFTDNATNGLDNPQKEVSPPLQRFLSHTPLKS